MSERPKLTNKQLLILMVASVLDMIWICLPGWAALAVGSFIGPLDGALGKQWGIFLLFALSVALMIAWLPTATKISAPLIKRLAKRIGVMSEKE